MSLRYLQEREENEKEREERCIEGRKYSNLATEVSGSYEQAPACQI
jgi:hypothetical protein